jgi:hypothetical protein
MKTLALLQPSYLPWIGYFNQVLSVDEFVFLDDVQYTKNDWRNRNRIKTPTGSLWLTLPVNDKNRISSKLLINQVEIKNNNDLLKHLTTIEMNYKKAKYYSEFYPILKDFLSQDWKMLSELNIDFIDLVLSYLGIKKKIHKSSDFDIEQTTKMDRIIKICNLFGADRYLSGSAAKDYINIDIFKRSNISVEFQNYDHPYYPQIWGEFISHLSIIDLLLNNGRKSINYI